MSRTRRRVSRILIACLGVTLALGLFFWIHNLNDSKASDAPATPVAGALPPAQPAAKAAEKKPEPAAHPPAEQKPAGLVMQTPAAPAPAPASPTPTAKPAQAPAPAPANTQVALATPSAPKSSNPFESSAPAVTLSAKPLADAQAKIDAGDLLGGRRILDAALSAGVLSPAEVQQAKQMLNTVNATVVFSQTRFPSDEFGGTYQVRNGDMLQRIASRNDLTWELLCRINGLSDPRRLRAGQSIKILKGPFHALVDKSDFTIEMWLGSPEEKGSLYVTSFKVGLGSNDSTPTGAWLVQNKLKNPAYYSPRGEGVIDPDDPKNPLGEFWIGLEGIDGHAVGKESYGIHGTIDPNSIGKQESMGCIRLRNEDVARVYEMLVEGKSTVIVRD